MKVLADDLKDLYSEGLVINGKKYFLVLVAVEGDLPAQAKILHCNLVNYF